MNEVKELPEHRAHWDWFGYFSVPAEEQCRQPYFGLHQQWVPHTSCLIPNGHSSWTIRPPAPPLSCKDGMASPLTLSRPSLGATLSRAGSLNRHSGP